LRLALIISALALLIAVTGVIGVTGVTPSEAARAVKRALNADRVDGLSASRRPQRGKLLALDKSRKFPPSVLPSARRGQRGSQGPPGPTGPSDGYITRKAVVDVPAGQPTLVAELRLPPGSYALDFVAHPYGTGPTQFVDCQLTANGALVVKTATLIGSDANAVLEAPVAMTDAAKFDAATALRALCSARNTGGVSMPDIRLRAIRLGSLTEQ
jgi:hypothetical protein